MYQSWFNKIRSGAAAKGVMINKILHKAVPVPEGKSWRRGTCPKCKGKHTGFVFITADKSIYILFCRKCNKFSYSSRQCVSIKRNKERCKNLAQENKVHCGVHKPKLFDIDKCNSQATTQEEVPTS